MSPRSKQSNTLKNVIAIDFVEDLIRMNWQGSDLMLNIEGTFSLMSSSYSRGLRKRYALFVSVENTEIDF